MPNIKKQIAVNILHFSLLVIFFFAIFIICTNYHFSLGGNSNESAKHKSAMGSDSEDAKVRRTNLNIEKWLKVSNVNEATLGS